MYTCGVCAADVNLWEEQVPSGTLVVLSGRDALMAAPQVRGAQTTTGRQAGSSNCSNIVTGQDRVCSGVTLRGMTPAVVSCSIIERGVMGLFQPQPASVCKLLRPARSCVQVGCTAATTH